MLLAAAGFMGGRAGAGPAAGLCGGAAGVKGGLAEGNLSAYLVAAAGSPAYVSLDGAACAPAWSGPWPPAR